MYFPVCIRNEAKMIVSWILRGEDTECVLNDQRVVSLGKNYWIDTTSYSIDLLHLAMRFPNRKTIWFDVLCIAKREVKKKNEWQVVFWVRLVQVTWFIHSSNYHYRNSTTMNMRCWRIMFSMRRMEVLEVIKVWRN